MKKNYTLYYVLLILVNVLSLIGVLLFEGTENPFILVIPCIVSVVVATLLISWGAEVAQFIISQGLAVAIVAFLQILPEFTIEAVISYLAGVEHVGKIKLPSNQPSYHSLMLANLTGSNRLLIGLGWPLIFITTFFSGLIKRKQIIKGISLKPENILESLTLLIGSGYYIIIILKGTITILDAAILIGVYAFYLYILEKLPPESEETKELLVPIAKYIAYRPRKQQLFWIITFFVLGLATMLIAAHPFVESLKSVAIELGIEPFVVIQWIAPFLSEMPEKLTAFYWALTIYFSSMALVNMISAQVGQWTLLVSILPVVYAIGAGGFYPIELTHHQIEELLLSVAMAVYASVILLKHKFTVQDALILLVTWLIQFLYPHKIPVVSNLANLSSHMIMTIVFVLLTLLELLFHIKRYSIIKDIKMLILKLRGTE